MIDQVLSAYGFTGDVSVTPHGTGLINRTWIVRRGKDHFVLQQVNHQVFTHPEYIADNIEMVGQYLAEHYPGIIFPMPVRATHGRTLVTLDDKYYRLYPYIENFLEDMAAVHRRIPRERMRYALDIPYIARESSAAEILALKQAWALVPG